MKVEKSVDDLAAHWAVMMGYYSASNWEKTTVGCLEQLWVDVWELPLVVLRAHHLVALKALSSVALLADGLVDVLADRWVNLQAEKWVALQADNWAELWAHSRDILLEDSLGTTMAACWVGYWDYS